MSDMYMDIERSIQQALKAAVVPINGLVISIFNNMVSKANFADVHGAISIMKVSDVFAPANSGGTGAYIKTPVPNGTGGNTSFVVQDWPDPYDLVYALTVSAETVKNSVTAGGITVAGIDIVRACDAMIRTTLRPRQPLRIWDSTLNAGTGGWSANYVNYAYAGYINRDSPDDEIYNRVTNIRFEVFNYQSVPVSEGTIKEITTTLNNVPTTQP